MKDEQRLQLINELAQVLRDFEKSSAKHNEHGLALLTHAMLMILSLIRDMIQDDH